MKNFIRTVKLFAKTPQIMLTYLGLLILSNYYLWHLLSAFLSELNKFGSESTDSYYFFADIMILCFVFSACWFFISFEFMRKVKESDLLEALEAMGKKGTRIYVNQLLVILLAIVLFLINVFVYFLFGFIKLDYPPILVLQVRDLILVDVLLLSIASSCMGIVVAQTRKRIMGYIVMIVVFLFSIHDYLEAAVNSMGGTGEILYIIRRYISFLPPNIKNTLDALYGLPHEVYRIAAMLLWVVLGMYVLFRKWFRGKTKVAFFSMTVIVVAGLGYCVQNPGSVLVMDETINQISREELSEEQEEKKADFAISGYDMDIRIGKEFSNHCTVSISDPKRTDEYLFTLYRGYRIKKISDQTGNPVDFSQTGDFVTVYGGNGQALSELTFEYRGSSNLFYSNRNACFLPGFFPYYPRAGFQPVFSADGMPIVQKWKNEEVSFRVKADMPETFICNLPREGGYYTGKAESLLLLGGNYDRNQYRENRCICYPMQKYSYTIAESVGSGRLQGRLDSLTGFLGGEPIPLNEKLVVCLPTSTTFASFLSACYDTDTYILLQNEECEFDILENCMEGKNEGELKKIFFGIQPGPEMDLSGLQKRKEFVEPEHYTKEDELADTVITKMEQLGVQKVAGEIYRYLNSDTYEGGVEKDLDFVKEIH